MWIWILTKNDSFYTQRDILPAFYMQLIVYCRYLLCIRLLQLSYWFFINLINARLFIHVYHQVRYLDISGSNLIKEVLHNLQSTIKINWSLQKIKEKKDDSKKLIIILMLTSYLSPYNRFFFIVCWDEVSVSKHCTRTCISYYVIQVFCMFISYRPVICWFPTVSWYFVCFNVQ